MSEYVNSLLAQVKAKNPSEPEFHQAVQEVAESLELVLERHPEYRHAKILERMVESSCSESPGWTIRERSTSTGAFGSR